MAQHGYLREYDEGWDRGDDRERSDRDWQDRDRNWERERERDRDRSFMFDERDRGGREGRHNERSAFSPMGERAQSMFREDDRQYRQSHSDWDWDRGQSSDRGYGRESHYGDRQQRASSHPDDHYRSWRDRQMQALDRDYADYCREREQQFHRDFDSWRQNRQQRQHGGQDQSQGMAQSRNQDELVLGAEHAEHGGLAAGTIDQAAPSGESEATLGTNNPQNSATGRGRR